jgi:hypothetical protein
MGTVYQPSHTIMTGVSSVGAVWHITSSAINPGASQIFDWSDGSVGAAEKSFPSTGKTVVLNMFAGDWSGDASLLLANTAAYLYVLPPACNFSDSVYILVNPYPAAAGAITGDLTVCQDVIGIPYSISAIVDADSYTWSYSGTGAVINGTGTSITVDFPMGSTSGDLTVYGTNECGDGTSSYISIVVDPCVGIGENNGEAAVTILPNPNNGVFSIEFSAAASDNYILKVYNALGQLVLNEKIAVKKGLNRKDINLEGQPTGTYYLNMTSDEFEAVKSFIITK